MHVMPNLQIQKIVSTILKSCIWSFMISGKRFFVLSGKKTKNKTVARVNFMIMCARGLSNKLHVVPH